MERQVNEISEISIASLDLTENHSD